MTDTAGVIRGGAGRAASTGLSLATYASPSRGGIARAYGTIQLKFLVPCSGVIRGGAGRAILSTLTLWYRTGSIRGGAARAIGQTRLAAVLAVGSGLARGGSPRAFGQTTVTVAPFVPDAPASPALTQIIDAARIRHWSFADIELTDGACLLVLNQRQRSLLARFGASIEGIVTRTLTIASIIDGALIGVQEDGVTPNTADTIEPGYAVQLDDVSGDLYIETDAPVIMDPFGADGGETIGFPLPADFVRQTDLVLVLHDNTLQPVDIVGEDQRFERRRKPAMFVNGNRLVPCRLLAAGNSDIWSRVAAVQLSYVPIQTIDTMDDDVTLPIVLQEALTASLAYAMARQSRQLTAAERRAFREEELLMETKLDEAALDMVRQENHVVFQH